MPEVDFSSVAANDILMLLSGIALIVGGIVLTSSGARIRRQALARRVDFVQPSRGGGLRKQRAPDIGLSRLPTQGKATQNRREATRRLAKLGVPARYAYAVFSGLRLLFAAGLGALALMVVPRIGGLAGDRVLPVLIAVALGTLGWFIFSAVLPALVKRRAKAVAIGLPDALELLIVCVEAGLSLENGIDRIVGELEEVQPALAEELALISADFKILQSRDEAFANLAERVDIPIVRSVVLTLSQTMRYGTPLAQALRQVAKEMRTEALVQLEGRANRLPALMTIPMMLFIMPTIFLILGGPAVLTLLDSLHR